MLEDQAENPISSWGKITFERFFVIRVETKKSEIQNWKSEKPILMNRWQGT